MAETSSSTTVSTKLKRIAKLARGMPQAALTTLTHHIDIDWLREAYRRTRKTQRLRAWGFHRTPRNRLIRRRRQDLPGSWRTPI